MNIWNVIFDNLQKKTTFAVKNMKMSASSLLNICRTVAFNIRTCLIYCVK